MTGNSAREPLQDARRDVGLIPFKELRGREPIYVAGPMSGRDDLNWPAFRAVEIELQSNGIYTLVPHRIVRIISVSTGELLPTGHPDRDDVSDITCFSWAISRMIGAAQVVVLLDGWRNSEGARAEVAVARRLRLPVYEVSYADGVPVGVIAK